MGYQSAYRRSRRAGRHRPESSESAPTMCSQSKHVYAASVSVDGAFDAVPHTQFMRTVGGLGVDGCNSRFPSGWLPRREFSVRLSIPSGRFWSSWMRPSRELPQGGVLSPFFWLLHFNPKVLRLRGARRFHTGRLETVGYQDLLFYTDDVVCATACGNRAIFFRPPGTMRRTLSGSWRRWGWVLARVSQRIC